MADVNVSIALAGIADIEKSLAGLKTQFDGLGTTGKTASASLNEMGTSLATTGAKVTLLTAPLALFGKSLIQSAADYESAMKTLEVSSGASVAEMDKVAESAKKIGAETTFSTAEAVTGFQALATTGVTLKDAFDGVMQATVNFAAATKTELGPAAEFAGDTMKSFNLAATEMPAALNAVYNATLQSKFGVDDFSFALSNAAPAAMQLNVPFNELNALLATTSSGFRSGMETGTSMGLFLQNLSPTTKAASGAMQELGLITKDGSNAFFDAGGKLKSLDEIQTTLISTFSKLTDEQRLQYAATIFGQQGMDTLNQILIQGVDAYEQNLVAINKQGTALAASKAQMEGLNGALDQLGGAIELLSVALFEAGVIDWLTDAVLWIGNTVAEISKADPFWVKLAAVIGGIAIAAGPVLIVLGAIVTALGALLTPIGLVVTAVAGIGAAFVALLAYSDDLQTFFVDLAAYAQGLWQSWDGTFKGLVTLIGTAMAEIGTALFEAIKAWGPEALNNVGYVVGQIIAGFANLAFELAKLGATGIKSLWQSFKDATADMNWIEITAAIIKAIADGLLAIAKVALDCGEALITGIAKGIKDSIGTTLKGALDSVYTFFGGVPEKIGKEVEPVTDAIIDPIAAVPAKIKPIGDDVVKPFTRWPQDIGKAVAPVEDALVKPFERASDALVGHSIVPEMTDKVIDLFSEMEDEVGTISEIMADTVEREINAILDDTTLSMEEQAAALARLGPRYQSMGQYGAAAMDVLQPKVDNLNTAIAKNGDVLAGVETALTENIAAWGGWGESANRIVAGFSQTAEASLSEFFMTGEFQLEEFGLSIKRILADEAAKTIVKFASDAAKQFLGLGTTMESSMATGAAGLDQAGASATAASASMGWVAVAIAAIVAALVIFKLAGGEFGDLLEKIGDIAKALGEILLKAVLAPVELLIAGFAKLIDLLKVFIGWIGTIGDELGKGDLKDLFKVFGDFNPLKGIGDFFSGLFDGFGFHKGGLIPGKGDIAIRAEGGEFVMSKAATDKFAPLLAAMNDYGLGRSMNVAATVAGDVARADPFKAFASGGDMMLTRPTLLLGGESGPEMVSFRHGQRGGNDPAIVNNGILVADRLTLNQLGKKLYRNAQRDQLRTRKR